MISKMMTLGLETEEKTHFVIRYRTNGQFKLACQMQMRSIQRMDALAKSLSTKQAEGEVCNNLHALGEKVLNGSRSKRCLSLPPAITVWIPFL